jgi:hypothetical protein
MKFIHISEIQVGDTIAWALGPSLSSSPSILYYEVEKIDRADPQQTIVHGKSFGPGGERWKSTTEKWDVVPMYTDILLISRKPTETNEPENLQ